MIRDKDFTAKAARASEVRLERRPEALVLQVDDLVADIESGKIRVPKFQRAFTWTDEDRRKLFDSIYRGYPVGTLLLWRHVAPKDEVDWGGLRIQADKRSDALFVVDGQQRLATLALALLGAEQSAGVRRLYFDPELHEVKIGTRKRPAPTTWLPVSSAGDPSRVAEWLGSASRGPDIEAAAKDFAKRVQQARFPAYVVDTEDEAAVRGIFERVNRSGHPLKSPEVFDALHGAFRGERPSSLREMASALAQGTRFGALEDDTVLAAVFAIHRGAPVRGHEDVLSDLTPAERDDLMDQTLRALRRSIELMRDDAGIPHHRLVPYASAIPILARFFHFHPAPHPRSRLLLRRWLFRGALTGAHSSDTVAKRLALEAVGDNEHRSIQTLLKATDAARPTSIAPLEPFDSRHARSRLELLALASLEPRSLPTREPVDIAALLEKSEHAPIIVPRVSVKDHKVAGTIANRALHDRHRLAQKLGQTTDDELLASHAVSRDAQRALQTGDAVGFLRLREKTIEGVVAEFLTAQAELGADDGPPIDALTIEDAAP